MCGIKQITQASKFDLSNINVAINRIKTCSVIAGVFGQEKCPEKLLIVTKEFNAQRKVI